MNARSQVVCETYAVFFNSGRLGDYLIAKVINLDKLNTICWCSVFTHWGHSDLWLVLSGAHSLRAAISLVDSDPLGDHTQCATELCRQIMLPWKPILSLTAVLLCVWLHVFVCIFCYFFAPVDLFVWLNYLGCLNCQTVFRWIKIEYLALSELAGIG